MKFDLAIKKPKPVSIKVADIKYMLLLIFCFFPYLNILHLPTDTQPNALIVSIIILLKNHKGKIPKFYILFFILFYAAIVMLVLSNFELGSILSFSNYTSVLIVPLAVYYMLKHYNGLSFDFFKKVVWTWGIVGIVQKFLYPRFMIALLSRISGIGNVLDGRGVVSLAPEPTYFGSMVLLFLIIYCLMFSDKKDYVILGLMFIESVFLSKSSTSLMVLAIATSLFFVIQFFRSSIKRMIMITVYSVPGSIALMLLLPVLFDGTRVKNIFLVIVNNPKLIFLDTSITERFNAAYFSTLSMLENFGLPQGFGTYQAYILKKSLMREYEYLFIGYRPEGYNRILSGFGMGFFELGIFGLLIPILIFIAIRKELYKSHVLFAYILFNLLLFTAMSLNNAMILFVIGAMIFMTSDKSKYLYKKGVTAQAAN